MIAWAIRRPALVAAVAAGMLLAGAVAFTRLPIATRPVVELPRLQVTAEWPGSAAELVEAYVTAPIEAVAQGVRGVRTVTSDSDEGRAQLTIHLEPVANVQLARLAILERLELLRSEFPAGVTPPRVQNHVPQELAEQPLLRYTMSGPYTPGTLARVARQALEPRIAAVTGVGGIIVAGGAETDVSVAYDATRLRQLQVDPTALSTAIAQARIVRPLGERRAGPRTTPVVLRDRATDIRDLADLPIPGRGGAVHTLGALAVVRLEEDGRDQLYRVNGEPAVAIVVSRLAGADAIGTARSVRHVVAEVEAQLPLGVHVRLQSDESADLARRLRDLTMRGFAAAGAVLLVLVIMLRDARAVGLALGSVLVAVAGTALGLYLLRIPANLLTIAGLSMGVGILVQNGAVVVERLRWAGSAPEDRAAAGARITPAVLGTTLTTAVVLLPFLYLQGNARAAFAPFAAAFALALGWSVLSSVVMIPALSGRLVRQRPRQGRRLRLYARAVVRLVRWRWAALPAGAALVTVALWGFVTKVPRASWGPWWGQRSTLRASLTFTRGSDPSTLDRAMREFERIAVGRDGVDQTITQGWRDGAYMIVSFTPAGERSMVPYLLEEEITRRAMLIGGAQVSVSYQGPGYFSGGDGASPQFRIRLLGYSFNGTARLAQDVKARLERIPRVRHVDANAASFWRQERAVVVTLEPDRAALARFGLTARDLAGALGREAGGPVGATRLEIGGEELRVAVKRAGARERTLDELRQALVPNAARAPVRIADVARVDEREALSRISREDQQYVRIVSYEFRGPQRLAERTHKSFLQAISLPPGYQVDEESFGFGDDRSARGLWLVFAAGVVLVILAVALVFDSVWGTAMVVLSLPVALGGAGAAFWIAGATFTREAAVGAILVVGLAVNQAILLVDACLARRRARSPIGRPTGPLTAADVVRACRDRAGLIVLVTLTTLASLVPLAVGTDPSEMFGAIALATTGGIIAGTLGALLLLPACLLPWSRTAR